MGKLAFVFPGQGAQVPGMARDIVDTNAAARAVFDAGSAALGFDLYDMVMNGTEETLKITENTQPAIVAASLACLQPLLEAGIRPDFTAGLSLGEYTAHVLSGTFTVVDAIALVRKRGRFMQDAVPIGEGTMAAILNLAQADVEAVCAEAGAVGVCEPANFNCPGQIVIAGAVKAVEEACRLALEKGAKRAMILPVSAPFHCSMLKPAGDKLAGELAGISLGDMSVPVVTNVTGGIVASKEAVKELLVRQVSTSVRWEECIRTLLSEGVDTFVEIGPGKTLSGFIKKIDKSATVYNVENAESLSAVLAALKG